MILHHLNCLDVVWKPVQQTINVVVICAWIVCPIPTTVVAVTEPADPARDVRKDYVAVEIVSAVGILSVVTLTRVLLVRILTLIG